MADYRVRPATEADAAVICAIYNQGIEDRLATLDGRWVDTIIMEKLL